MRTALIGILLLWLTGCASLFGTPETVTVEKGDTLYSISKSCFKFAEFNLQMQQNSD